MRNAFINTILDAALQRDDIFIISGDAGLGVFDDFKERHPQRFLNMGVAEQNSMSFAAGLGMTGYKVIVYNIIPFLLYRAWEQVRNDICYQKVPVVLAGIGSGLTYAPQGMTHYAVEDLGIARTLPNLTTLSPIDPVEARQSAIHALDAQVPVYVRLAKRGEPTLHQNQHFDITRPQVLAEGEDIALVCHGSIAEEVIRAGRELVASGIRPRIVSVPMIQPLNHKALAALLKGFAAVICIEEHDISCGLGAMLPDLMLEYGLTCRLKRLGIPHQFIHQILSTAGMRTCFGIDAAGIAAAAQALARPGYRGNLQSAGCVGSGQYTPPRYASEIR